MVIRPYKVTNKKKAIEKLGCADQEVYLVLEEDGTELKDEEYFQTLLDNTRLMLLLHPDIWSPVGHQYK